MSRVLDMIVAAMVSTFEAVQQWLSGTFGNEAGTVAIALSALVVLLVLLVVSAASPRRRGAAREEPGRPELLVSPGAVRTLEESSLTFLDAHVSNLGSQPVQLLEAALTTDLMPTPQIIELAMLVPAGRSVDVEVQVDELHGETGLLELFFYTPGSRRRAFRLRANLEWEPWNGRFRVDPLAQRLDVARRLASSRLARRQREEWRKSRLVTAEAPVATLEPAEDDDRADEAPRERLQFPREF